MYLEAQSGHGESVKTDGFVSWFFLGIVADVVLHLELVMLCSVVDTTLVDTCKCRIVNRGAGRGKRARGDVLATVR